MNFFIATLISIYSKLLLLYPGNFRKEFGDEMQVVFGDSVKEAGKDGILFLVIVGMREMVNLPGSVLQEFWHERKKKETIMDMNEQTESKSGIKGGTSYWDALIGTLPFVLFGIVSMIGKIRIPFWGIYAALAFYVIVLLGLLIGLIKGVPRWAYSYLGWTLVFAWWWSSMGTQGLKIFGLQINYWSWQIWPPLLVTIGIALVWTRSLLPFRQLVRGIWKDWTLLSLAMYTFVGWMALIYDENRHPYLFAFMIGSTIAVSAGAWFFLHERQTRNQIIALLSGFVTLAIIGAISEATWDWHAYYGFPEPPPIDWYVSALRIIVMFAVWTAILFWPALIGLVRRSLSSE